MGCKCAACEIMKAANNAAEPSVCIWFMDHIIRGDKKIEECAEYIPIEIKEKNNG